jgi:hypothetical protein
MVPRGSTENTAPTTFQSLHEGAAREIQGEKVVQTSKRVGRVRKVSRSHSRRV